MARAYVSLDADRRSGWTTGSGAWGHVLFQRPHVL